MSDHGDLLGLKFSYRKCFSCYVADKPELMEKNLLLHKAVPQSTGAQSDCLIPDPGGLHLGGESTTVINSCWFNKLHNRLQSRLCSSPIQKDASLRNFPKLCPTDKVKN